MPYMICDKCNKFYKLKEGESYEDFDLCECGNKLKYYLYLTDYTKGLNSLKMDSNDENLIDIWFKQSGKVKLASILVVCLLGIFLVAGISGSFYSGSSATGASPASKPTLVVLHASWCSACHEFDKTLSDPKVKEKISKNYNFKSIDVDYSRDEANKYAKNGRILLPTSIILDANGNEVKRYEGYMNPDEFLGFL
ncbi:MAG TPA: thioredoxin family protein [Methanobacterium sp.]|nr:thioredoxin family protein [Methanobacterium sp.]